MTSTKLLSLDTTVAEWADVAAEPKVEILRRLCQFGQDGLVFDRMVFKRLDGSYINSHKVSIIAENIFSSNQILAADANKALSELKVIASAIQVFCRTTYTRLPDIALCGEPRGAWLDFKYLVPPSRNPTPSEIAAANILCDMNGIKALGGVRVLSEPSMHIRRWSIDRIIATSRSRCAPAARKKEPAVRDAITRQPTAQAQPAKLKPMSDTAFKTWYQGFVRTWVSVNPPTKDEEKAAFKLDHPDKHVSRDRFRAARAKFGRTHWRIRGRRPASRNSANNSADN